MNDPNNTAPVPHDPQVPAQLVQVGSYTVDAAQAESEEAAKHTSGGEFFKFKVGPNILRFLPPPPGGDSPFKIRWRHWIDLPNGEAVKFNCPKKMAGQHCPICEKADAYKASADKNERDKGWNMSPSRRALANAIDRTASTDGPVIVDMPGKMVYDPLVSMRQDARGGGDFTDPMQGFDVIVKRTGEGKKKKTGYEVLADRNNSQLADTVEQMNDWIMTQADLAGYMSVPTAEEIKEMFAEAMAEGGATAAASAPATAPRIAAPPQQPAASRQPTAQDRVHDTEVVSGAVTADDIPF